MSPITTHILDTSVGLPAAGVKVKLCRYAGGAWEALGEGVTDEDGRNRSLLPEGQALQPGVYRLLFETGAYFEAKGLKGFYPRVPVVFELPEPPAAHYHVPLLLNPYGYSTYRGS